MWHWGSKVSGQEHVMAHSAFSKAYRDADDIIFFLGDTVGSDFLFPVLQKCGRKNMSCIDNSVLREMRRQELGFFADSQREQGPWNSPLLISTGSSYYIDQDSCLPHYISALEMNKRKGNMHFHCVLGRAQYDFWFLCFPEC